MAPAFSAPARALPCRWLPILTLALGLAWAGLALADGDTRAATEPEKAFHARVQAACQKAAPATPAGWDLVDQSQPYQLDKVSTGLGKSPWPFSYRLSWQDSARLRASQEKTMQAGLALLARQKADPQAGQLQRQHEGLTKELGAALKKGDMAQAQQVQAQMEPLQRQLQQMHDEFDRQYQAAQRENQAQDARASLSIQINAQYEEFSGPVSEEPPLEGRRVWRSQGQQVPGQDWREGVSLVLLGQWSQGQSGAGAPLFKAQPRADLPATAVQSVAVRLTANPERARQLLKGLDWARLEELIAR